MGGCVLGRGNVGGEAVMLHLSISLVAYLPLPPRIRTGLGIEDHTKQIMLTTHTPQSKTATLWKRPPAAASPATPQFAIADDGALAEAKAFQKSLRKEKADLQILAEKGSLGGGVGFLHTTPQSIGRKESMRNMLSDTLTTAGRGSSPLGSSPMAGLSTSKTGSSAGNRMSFGFTMQTVRTRSTT